MTITLTLSQLNVRIISEWYVDHTDPGPAVCKNPFSGLCGSHWPWTSCVRDPFGWVHGSGWPQWQCAAEWAWSPGAPCRCWVPSEEEGKAGLFPWAASRSTPESQVRKDPAEKPTTHSLQWLIQYNLITTVQQGELCAHAKFTHALTFLINKCEHPNLRATSTCTVTMFRLIIRHKQIKLLKKT